MRESVEVGTNLGKKRGKERQWKKSVEVGMDIECREKG